MEAFNQALHGILWNPLVLVIMLAFGCYLVWKLHFFSLLFRNTFKMLSSLTLPDTKKQGLSNWQIIATNLGAVMGIGNLVGVATAIVSGGAGALFWMWISSLIVSTLKYGEILLALRYRKKDSCNEYVGGPMYYIEQGVGSKMLGKVYAVLLLVSSFGIGNLVASNAMAHALSQGVGFSPLFWGVVFMAIMTVVLCGGLKAVVSISEWLVPLMVLAYCASCFFIVVQEWDQVLLMITRVVEEAVGIRAIAGGSIGACMKYGISRGVFSHEAGMGSATLTHVKSTNQDLVSQSMIGCLEVFMDTLVMCTLSGFVILLSEVPLTITSPVLLLSTVFQTYFSVFGRDFVLASIVLFGFASMMGWYYYGVSCLRYLTAAKGGMVLYTLLFLLSLAAGALFDGDTLWMLSDNLNGMVLWVNVLALFLLRKVIIRESK